PTCVLDDAPVEPPWLPLELRSIVGVGRKRALQLTREASQRGLEPQAADLEQALQAVPGIGPILAHRVGSWVTQRRSEAYTLASRSPVPGPNVPP
ncbi:MAG TPA: helix-hairpin-helix domain-containing protein, partial [Planctomycetota bacterium]|nr:helix-hairpin-helix domain-containing protein [Planctomycetota bacterium]